MVSDDFEKRFESIHVYSLPKLSNRIFKLDFQRCDVKQ